MRTIGEVAKLANVTVRTLHHYDEIGLVRPSGRTEAGYRLYDGSDLQRLQTVLFYRELGFPLDDIRAVMADADFDRGQALREQRKLLEAQAHRLERMIAAVDAALQTHERGRTMSDEAMFAVFGDDQREFREEAEQRWGDTDAWAESRDRTARYTVQDWEDVKAESAAIMARILDAYRLGAAPDSDAAMDAVEAHRRQISARFYECSHEMHVGLGEMYVADPRFTATYEGLAEGLTGWVREAIRANADRAVGSG
ncbi:MAG TPA: MerR family transcriptional regulator [Nitriliruptorales bacterium]|nr:MerR family transcriptional regulator [Nitriliruptorales bacterium]